MRTTLHIDDDVFAAAKELSRLQGRSTGSVASSLMRLALTRGAAPEPAHASSAQRSVAGFSPFQSRSKAVGNDTIDQLRDQEGV